MCVNMLGLAFSPSPSQSFATLYSVDTLLMTVYLATHPLLIILEDGLLAVCVWKSGPPTQTPWSLPLWIQYLSLCPQGAVPGMWGPQCEGWSFLPVSREARDQCDLPSPSLNVLWKTPAGSSLLIQARAFRAASCGSLPSPAERQPC